MCIHINSIIILYSLGAQSSPKSSRILSFSEIQTLKKLNKKNLFCNPELIVQYEFLCTSRNIIPKIAYSDGIMITKKVGFKTNRLTKSTGHERNLRYIDSIFQFSH